MSHQGRLEPCLWGRSPKPEGREAPNLEPISFINPQSKFRNPQSAIVMGLVRPYQMLSI